MMNKEKHEIKRNYQIVAIIYKLLVEEVLLVFDLLKWLNEEEEAAAAATATTKKKQRKPFLFSAHEFYYVLHHLGQLHTLDIAYGSNQKCMTAANKYRKAAYRYGMKSANENELQVLFSPLFSLSLSFSCRGLTPETELPRREKKIAISKVLFAKSTFHMTSFT